MDTNPTDQQPKPTGDQIMTAAKKAAAEVFPDAAPTASDHANLVAKKLIDALNGKW